MFSKPDAIDIPIHKKRPEVCLARPDCVIKRKPDHKWDKFSKDDDRERLLKNKVCK